MKQWTISRLDCDMGQKVHFIQPVTTAQWLDWEKAPEHFSKPNLHQKRSFSLSGGLLVWSTTAFWILAKPFHMKHAQIKEMQRKLQQLQLASVNIKGLILLHDNARCRSHNQHFKSWTNWATELCLIHHIHLISCQPTTTSSSISTPFCRANTSTTSRMQKMLSKSSLNPKAWIFMLQE